MKQPKHFTLPRDADTEDLGTASDRRQAPRRKILKAARIYWGNDAWTDCIVRNLSDTGAQLEISAPVPKTFDLVIANRLACTCCVVWRQGNRVGVRFQRQIQMVQTLPTSVLSACRQHADDCRVLAERARASERDILLNMAAAWETVGLRYRRKSRALSGA
jgi:hypothetical protein